MRKFLYLAILLLTICSCSKHGRDIAGSLAQKDFDERYANGLPEGLETLLESDSVTPEEKEALTFLYAYMPDNDATDYTPQFFLDNVRASFQAAEEMPWGKIVPDREFRHFVLPVRTNNENIDSSRVVFYEELKDRVKGMSMTEAILEVNHWCHEKVSYKASNSRTNSPLASVCSATGRCGEESTFTVAALRAVGIPARQIYTPRWAHTDDNHAWVEAWADGEWHFLGACEPEVVLDLGWFNEPASRGMLMSTNVFGNYDGPEEQLSQNAITTTINVTSNYAPVSIIDVQVVDDKGQPVADAKVNFCIYNYGEFYPAVQKETDADGHASLLAGHGDIVVWATNGQKFGIAKANYQEPCTVTLSYGPDYTGTVSLDLVPPSISGTIPTVAPDKAAENDRRKAIEDSIRMAYTATFYTPERTAALAQSIGADAKRLQPIMENAKGNWPVIETFLKEYKDSTYSIDLLESLASKDLNDVTYEVLADQITAVLPAGASKDIKSYVLSPRVANEKLWPYRTVLSKWMEQTVNNDPQKLIQWISDNLNIDATRNPKSYPTSPLGVLQTKITDPLSRDIFFVAAARSAGIPARINAVTSDLEYIDSTNNWQIVDFEAKKSEDPTKGYADFGYIHTGSGAIPAYYSQFTISKITNGVPQLMEYDESANANDILTKPLELAPGQYMLVTGKRLADGSVLVRAEFFLVEANKTTKVPFEIRSDSRSISVIGNFDAESKYKPLKGGEPQSIISTTGRGYYVLGFINPSHEPSAHALNDMSAIRSELEGTGLKMVVLLPEGTASRFDASHFPNLPDNIVLGTDPNNELRKQLSESLNINAESLPIFAVADTFNRVVWYSQGYDIGLGQKLMDLLNHLDN